MRDVAWNGNKQSNVDFSIFSCDDTAIDWQTRLVGVSARCQRISASFQKVLLMTNLSMMNHHSMASYNHANDEVFQTFTVLFLQNLILY